MRGGFRGQQWVGEEGSGGQGDGGDRRAVLFGHQGVANGARAPGDDGEAAYGARVVCCRGANDEEVVIDVSAAEQERGHDGGSRSGTDAIRALR